MSKRHPNAHQAQAKGQFNSLNRPGKCNHQRSGQQKQQQQQDSQEQPSSVLLTPPALTLSERVNASLSAGYSGKFNKNHKNHDGGSSQNIHQSSSQHQNAQYSHAELTSNGMESNPTRSSTPSRGRGGARGGRGGIGGRGRGNGENRGGRGGGYQGRNDDGRARNDSWNSPTTTLPAGNEADEEFEDNVRDLTAMPASRMAKFSNNSLEQASYEELKVARERERRDAIANGTIDDPEQRKTLEHAIDFVGTCMDMCPLFERQQRAVQNAVDRWEINPSTGKIDKDLAVKQFHRPAAGNDAQLPSDVRPPPILVSTLDYLINNIAGGSESLELTHSFLRDRTRGIRQDFTLQNYRGSETVACHELIARFHILSIHKLCEETKNFVPQQEMEQLQKVLTTLSELYEDARLVNIIYPNEPEFRAYQIIAHLRDPDQERQAQRWPDHVFNSKPVQQALRFLTLTQRNNDEAVHMRVGNAESCSNFFGTVFRLVKAKSTSYLMACLLETHFNEIRKTALKAIKNTYRPDTKQLLLKDVVEMLAYENEGMAFRDCEYYGIGLGQVEVEGQMVWHLMIRKGGANWNEGLSALRQSFHTKLVESKIGNRSIPDIIYGRRVDGSKGFNPGVAPFVPGATASRGPLIATLKTGPFSQGLTQSAFNKAPIATLHNPTITPTFGLQKPITTPAFGSAAQQPSQTGSQYTASKPIVGTFASATLQQTPNVFQKASNVPKQATNVFQKASNNMMPSAFKSQTAAGPVTPASVFQTGTPTWGTSQKSQDPRLSQESTQPPVSVFAPGAKKLPAPSTIVPSSVFTPKVSMQTAGNNVFKQAQATTPVNRLPSGIFSAPVATSATPSQSLGFQQGPVNGIFQPSNPILLTSESFFQQGPSGLPPLPTSLPTPSQSGFQPGQTPSAGLLQPQEPSQSSQSVFQQAPPKATSNRLFQQPITTTSSPFPLPSITSSTLFGPQTTTQQSSAAVATTNSSTGSIFDSYTGHKSFPSNFFSVPITPTDGEEGDDAYSAPVPIQTVSCGSLFDHVGNALARSTTSRPAVGASRALPSFIPPTSFTHSSSVTPSSSFRVPNLPPQPIPSPPSAQSVEQKSPPVAKPLVSRSAAWELANSLFDEIITKEVAKAVQSAVGEDKAKVISVVAVEKYKDAEKLVARKLALDIAAEQFYANRSGANIFYVWKAKARKLMMKRIGEERRRNPPAPSPVQWRPVQIPEGVFDGPITEVQRMTALTYQSVPLKEIFLPKVEQAFWPTGEGGRRWRLLCKSANAAVDIGNYWWIEKFVGNSEPRIAMSKKGTFEVQFDLTDAHAEGREVGGFVFGCSADYSIPNKERFKKDKANLHEAVNWLASTTEFPNLAVMVVCYRSPLDTEDADPYGRDMGRTSGPGRRARIAAVRKALDLDAFDRRIIGRDIILVENLGDCNFTPAIKKFSGLVLETVNPKVAEMMSQTPSPEAMVKQNSAKRKHAAKQQQLSVGSPKPTKPVITSEGRSKRQRTVQNVGMQTNYFTIKSRGLHVDWNKFQMPGGGTLGDGVENPVGEEYLVTTTPITTPERRPVLPKNSSSPLLDGLKDDLQDLERIMIEVNGMFDEGIEQLEDMKKKVEEIGDFNLAMENQW